MVNLSPGHSLRLTLKLYSQTYPLAIAHPVRSGRMGEGIFRFQHLFDSRHCGSGWKSLPGHMNQTTSALLLETRSPLGTPPGMVSRRDVPADARKHCIQMQ